ncbi:MAG: tetratricopeptide repeat protein, partial [Marinirhabdus sp.]
SANYHFKYGGAMGMKALNISRIRAVTYIGDIKKHFETAARLDLNHIEVRWALVEFYMQLPGILGGSEKKAQKYASQLLKISPVNGYLANGYIAEQGKRPKDAEVHYKKAIKTAPAGFKAHKNNRLNYQLGKIAAEYNIKAALGINSLRQYIKNYSNRDGVPKDWAYYRLAQIYKNLGEKQTALQWIGKALKARPNFEQAKAEQREIQGLKVQNSKRINKP